MKGKITITIIIGLMCFVLIYVMFIQFKTIEETDITSIESMREDELRTELASWKTKHEEIDKKLQLTQETLSEYNQLIEANQEASELLKKELEEAYILIGKEDVKGEGIIVTLADNNEMNIEVADLLDLINELRLAGAEAISINEERIINMSDLASINNTFIVTNGRKITSPFIVKAIGNQTYLESGLMQKAGYIDTMQKSGKTVSLEKEKSITILKYSGDINLQYIK